MTDTQNMAIERGKPISQAVRRDTSEYLTLDNHCSGPFYGHIVLENREQALAYAKAASTRSGWDPTH